MMELMLNKKHVNQVSSGKFKDFFIVEDLTPMRSHLLWYAKKNFAHKFHKFHTRNGVIKCKDKSDVSNDGKWKSMENPDDLHALVGDDKALRYGGGGRILLNFFVNFMTLQGLTPFLFLFLLSSLIISFSFFLKKGHKMSYIQPSIHVPLYTKHLKIAKSLTFQEEKL